jgi:hypothetical protein
MFDCAELSLTPGEAICNRPTGASLADDKTVMCPCKADEAGETGETREIGETGDGLAFEFDGGKALLFG